MGKHLAPKKKHELNFIKKMPKRVSGQRKAAHAAKTEAAPAPKKPRFKPVKTLPALGRYPWLFCAAAAVLLLVIRFIPLEGWTVPAAYAIPALLALPERIIAAYERFRCPAGAYHCRL